MLTYCKKKVDRRAFTLIEMIVIIIIFSMRVGVAMVSISNNTVKGKFKKEAEGFIHVLKMAQNASIETSQPYAVVLDFVNGMYLLMPYKSSDEDRTFAEEEIIIEGFFTENFWLEYALFDDGIDTRDLDEPDDDIFIWARRSGWDRAVKIGVRDAQDNEYSILTSRMSGKIQLVEGDAYMQWPREKRDVPF